MSETLWDWGPEDGVLFSRSREGDSQKERLLEAGVTLFARQGFEGTSIRDLAREAGCNSSLVSYHFGSKEGLYRAVLQGHFDVLMENLEVLKGRDEPPIRRLVSVCRLVMGMHRRYPHLWPLVLREMQRPTDALTEMFQRAVACLAGYVMETLREGIRQGLFREDLVPEHGTLALAGMLNFYFLSEPVSGFLIPRGPETDEIYAQQVLALFLDGVRLPEEDGR
ncbi:transcriptional regulator, TetR family [Aminomonas paucivorans DSM 12260]|uniref:Transcriptional regulator, TetR family n=1 Tax=Aminomonas paucivorans DSM 12260 TaxID=584708 RepID=E3CUB6_9BACT|nr:TetR family transcriptional regulator [Aminomonas paucivorans]EFQ23075.1 transcriptional regulator, TetR family [Aminomonas paucivorans DSM 12260]